MAVMTRWIAPIVFAIAVLVMTFVVGFEMIIFNEAYFEWHYENRGVTETTEMSIDDLMYVTDEMLDYLEGERASLDMQATIDGQMEEVFGEREKAHMVDVRDMYLAVRNARRVSMLIIGIILLAGLLRFKEMLYHVFNRMKYIIGVLMVFILILGGLFATNFQKYFTLFHELFFSNDLWLLDPRTDILINMVPESYFYSIVMIGVALFILMVIGALAVAQKLRGELAGKW